NDRVGMNILGQKIFGSMATTTYDEYILKGNSEFKGVTLDGTNNNIRINYNGTDYDINMDNDSYTSIDDLRFVKDLNDKIDATTLKGLVKAELKDGVVAFIGPRNFKIDVAGTNMDVKDAMGIDKGQDAVLSKVIVSDLDDIDREIFQGSTEYLLKSAGSFAGTTAGDNFVIYYGDNKYTITMDRAYTNAEDKEFIYDFNKKLAEIPGLAGHAKLEVRDGQFAISADKNFRLDAANFNKLGFEDVTSGLKGAKTAYALEGGKLDLFSNPLEITDGVNDKLYINYGGNSYTIDLDEKTYDGVSAGLTFNDLINDIQNKINTDPALQDLKGYVTVTGVNGSIRFNSDSAFKLKYDTPTDTALMTSLGFNTEKEGVLIGNRVESGGATQILGMLDKLIKDLSSNNPEGISKALSRIDAHLDNLNSVRAEVGVRTNRLNLTLNRIDDDNVNLRGLLSKNEDIDMAEVIINLQMQENVYNAALSVGSKIISLTLVDFIR
ncbi:MAG: flagellin, partial [Lutispora sp.]